MFDENDLRELLEFSGTDPILSIYLNTDPTMGNADAYRLRLRTMLKSVNAPKDVEAVELYMQHQYDWSGIGVVIFSCAAQKFFRAYPLEVPVRDHIHFGDLPSVQPLTDLLDSYGGYGVVLVDKQGARYFSFHMGQLHEQEGMLGDPVRHTKRGGASTIPGHRGGVAGRTRYTEEVIERNMKDAVEAAIQFFEENRIRRILIGGTDDNIAHFRSEMPKAWKSLVIGDFPMEMIASHAEVLQKAMQIGRVVERQREEKLVESAITAAAKGLNAVVGLQNVIPSVNEKRVQTLITGRGLQIPGHRCVSCHALLPANNQACPLCGGTLEPLEDILNAAINQVLRDGGDVQIVEVNDQLEQIGGVAAFLRY
ncbi:hypothetical protein ADN00_02990 [Ornatilinea apprima]|uniref:eRF1 domain-containing protein n=1 Tax=Ornatilinea apprima TaxID=1134406 RepID=A0A0P6XHL8_9CHLR|nr:hypothetical protein [Ornatilinea apprima]KPL79312.1 hypothetical protein ADN00_02990 [Ornatilinea apprima]